MSFLELGVQRGANIPEHNRLRGLGVGDPHPQYSAADHTHDGPLGVLGYAEVTANESGITSETDLTGLSVTVTVGSSRRIRVWGEGMSVRTVADGTTTGHIKEDATYLGRWASAADKETATSVKHSGSVVLTPSAGSHTYKLTLERSTGTGTVSLTAAATLPAFIMVEDLGAA